MRRGGTEPSPETLFLSQLDPVPVTERVTEARDKRVTVHDTLMTPVMQTDPFDQPPPHTLHCQGKSKTFRSFKVHERQNSATVTIAVWSLYVFYQSQIQQCKC